MRGLPAALLALLLVAVAPGPALAALTPSEQAVVKTFVQKGELAAAPRVRSLVARPDLTPEEVAAPLRAGYAGVPFDATRERFTDALLFGPGSHASRSSLGVAVVDALLARAATRMADVPFETGRRIGRKEREAAAEVLAIHRFVSLRIANAGNPPPDGFDASQGIRADARSAILKQYLSHWTSHERWLSSKESAPLDLVRLRAQVALTVSDLAAGVASRFEVAKALGLEGSRRAVFERHGLVVLTDRPVPEARIDDAIGLLDAAPGAAQGLGLWLLGKTSVADLSGRGGVVRAGVVLAESPRPVEPEALWPADVKPSTPDRALAAIALQVADRAAARALAGNRGLSERVRAAAERAAKVGPKGYLAADVLGRSLVREAADAAPPGSREILAAAVRLVLLDAPRAVDLALIRAGAGHAEPLEQLVLALSVLAAGRPEITVRRVEPSGLLSPLRLSEIAFTDGVVSGFTLADRKVTVAPDENGALRALVDGKPPKLTALASFQVLAQAGATWTFAGMELTRLSGEPRVAVLDDGRLVLEGGTGGYDGVAAGAEGADVRVAARVQVSSGSGALLVRAVQGETSLAGIGLVLEGKSPRARLLAFDGKGKAFELSPWVDLPPQPAGGHVVSVEVEGDALTARIGARTLTATAPAGTRPSGRAALATLGGGRVEVQALTVAPKVPRKK